MSLWSIALPILLSLAISTGSTVSIDTSKITIKIKDNAFEPRKVTVPKNSTVLFINQDRVPHWPASDIHPTHDVYPQFDPQKPINPSKSWGFKFKKPGVWRYHDHLFPHSRGEIIVEGKSSFFIFDFFENFSRLRKRISHYFLIRRGSNISLSSLPFETLSRTERFDFLDQTIKNKGPQAAWTYIVDIYSKTNADRASAHDFAHYIGSRIFEAKGTDGISLCTPTFAFGCYHGFTEAVFEKTEDGRLKTKDGIEKVLIDLAKACKSVGKVGSGPWASCIHGIGHGVATYFDNRELLLALKGCDNLSNGPTYCHDGVFMEFVTNAPGSVYESRAQLDSLYPCSTLDKKYRGACARNQPRVMAKFYQMSQAQIVNVCILTKDQTIKYHCIDAVGLDVGQRSGGNPNKIVQDCGIVENSAFNAQCISAAAGEIIFQNFRGWETAAPAACDTLPDDFKRSCHNRVNQTITSYRR